MTWQWFPVTGTRRSYFDDDLAAAVGLFDNEVTAAVVAAVARMDAKRARDLATSEAVLGLKEVTGTSREGEGCAVCLQGFRADETLRAMPCSHAFHHHCISEWLRRNATCPLCRQQLLPPPTAVTTLDVEDEDDERVRRRRRISIDRGLQAAADEV